MDAGPEVLPRLWRASWRQLVRDRELFLLPPLHFAAFLGAYLGPPLLMVLLVVGMGPRFEALAIVLVLGAVAVGMFGHLWLIGLFKLAVAASCRQRWTGDDPTVRSALREAWSVRKGLHGALPALHSLNTDTVGLVYGRPPLQGLRMDRYGPATLLVGSFVTSMTLGLLGAGLWLAARLPASWQTAGTAGAVVLGPGALLYTSGLVAMVASVGAAAQFHHMEHGTPPAGFEMLSGEP